MVNPNALAGWEAMRSAWCKSSLVVKIDVEGFEAGVVKGMTQLLSEKRCRKVIVELNQSRASKLNNDDNVDQIMQKLGYTPCVDPGIREHYDQCYIPAT